MAPPKEVPENLTADQYFKLSIQYTLMNWQLQGVAAFKKSIENHKDFSGTPLSWMRDEHYRNLGMALGVVEKGMEVQEFSKSAARNVFITVNQMVDGIEPIKNVRAGLGTALHSATESALGVLTNAASDIYLSVLKLPATESMPEGLTAERYYRMGVQYKLMGWTEHAREAFSRASKKEEIGYYGKKAREQLRTKLPRHSIHYKAVQKNRGGQNSFLRGELDAAKATFEELIEEYPQFEWAHGNLGRVYYCQGDTANARRVIQKALAINPSYVTGWVYLATVDCIDDNLRAAQEALNHALQLDPEEPNGRALTKILSTLTSLRA